MVIIVKDLDSLFKFLAEYPFFFDLFSSEYYRTKTVFFIEYNDKNKEGTVFVINNKYRVSNSVTDY